MPHRAPPAPLREAQKANREEQTDPNRADRVVCGPEPTALPDRRRGCS
jgi:hypothetical protein